MMQWNNWMFIVMVTLVTTLDVLVNALNNTTTTSPSLLSPPSSSSIPSPAAVAPTKKEVATLSPTSSYQEVVSTCNICGEGNIVTKPKALVTFQDHTFREETLECAHLQHHLANARTNHNNAPYPADFCTNLQRVAMPICGCTTTTEEEEEDLVFLSLIPGVGGGPERSPTTTTTTDTHPYSSKTTATSSATQPLARSSLERSTQESDSSSCNLCGDNNSIGNPNALFKFTDPSGDERELGCQQMQDLLDTGLAPDGWCDIVQAAAVEACQCLDPNGNLVSSGGTGSPGDDESNSSSGCWPCGYTDGVKNPMGDGEAVVDYIDHEGILRKFTCKQLAILGEDSIAVPLSYCPTLQEQASYPCRCTTPDGDLISSESYPTSSPANNGEQSAKPVLLGNTTNNTQSLPISTTNKTDGAEGTSCWACGYTDGVKNSMGDGEAVVDYIDPNGILRKFPCKQLALMFENTTVVPPSYCPKLQQQAMYPCRCTTPEGDLVSDKPVFLGNASNNTQSLPVPTTSNNNTTNNNNTNDASDGAEGTNSCWMCGYIDGVKNVMGDGDAVVDYVDQNGILRKFPCQQLALLGEDATAVPLSYCPKLQEQAMYPCNCTTPKGELLVTGSTDSNNNNNNTLATANKTVINNTNTNHSIGAENSCWVCGYTDGGVKNLMGDGEAVVNYIDQEGIMRKFPCKQLAQMGEDTTAVPTSYCPKLQEQAVVPCRCTTPEGDLISDLYPISSPTIDGNNSSNSSSNTEKKSDSTTTYSLLTHWKNRVGYFLEFFIMFIM